MRPYLFSALIVFAIILSSLNASAQLKKGTVKARLIDSATRQPIEFASIAIVTAKDSLVVRNSVSDKAGTLEFTGLAVGGYRLTVYQLGLRPVKMPFALTTAKPYADLGDIIMAPAVHALNQVDVKGEKAPVSIKGDTTEFNAGSFKTQPNDNVEALFKKLPGVDVDKDGKITAQGQTVKKVLVDGKEFFGNDPKAVTKNLPADAIDKVQLIDDKTDHTKNTGIDDGQREKVMNVTLKADKKHGWFGNVAAAGGTSDRYLGQFNLNHFDKTKQISFLFLSNNVNESGFTMEDLGNFTNNNVFGTFSSGNGGSYVSINSNGRADINGVFSGVSGGLVNNHSGGVNYTDEFGKKGQLKFNSSFIAVLSSNKITSNSNVLDAPNNIITDQVSGGHNSSYSYRLNFNIGYKPDTLNSFSFKPNLSIVNKSGLSSKTFNSTDSLYTFKNSGSQTLDQSALTPTYGGMFTVNHKFQHGKGSLNFYTINNYNGGNNNYNNQYSTRYIKNTAPVDSMYNQQNDQDNSSFYTTSTASYIRPLSLKRRIYFTLAQGMEYRSNIADQTTLQYNPVTGLYDIVVPAISGNYNNDTYRYTTTVGVNHSGDGKGTLPLTYNFNIEINNFGLDGTFNNNGYSSSVTRNNWYISPAANFYYRQKNGYSFNASVRMNVSQPSVNDLQPVFNNTNPLYVRQGNPDLKNSNTLNMYVSYNKFNSKSNTYFNLYANFSQTWNGFSTASVIDPVSGIQTSKPINTDGNYSCYIGFNVNKPTKIKGLKLSFNSYSNISKTVNSVNNADNAVTRLSPSGRVGFNYDIDRIQFGATVGGTYNFAQNSVQHLADQKFFQINNSVNLSVYPLKSLRVFGNMDQSGYTSQANRPSNYVYLLNAGIDQYFMNKMLTLSLNGFDLMNRNTGINRYISQTGQITNSQTNTIGQYFYLKLTYKITKVGGKDNDKMAAPVIIMR